MKQLDRRSVFTFTGMALSWIAFGSISKDLALIWTLMSALILWRKDKITELFIGFWLVLILSDSLEWQLAWAKTAKNIYILLLAAILVIDREKFKPFNTIYKKFLPFIVVAIVAMVAASPAPVLMDSAMRTLSYFLILLVVPNYVTRIYRERGEVVFREIALFGFVVLAGGYIYKYIDLQLVISHGGRLRGFFGNPNGLGLFLIVFFVLFYLVNKTYPKLFLKWERWAIYIVVALCVISSASRNSMISIVLFLLFVRSFKISFGMGVISVLFGIGGYYLISSNIVEIIVYFDLQDYFRVETLEEGSGRFLAWQFAWENIQDYFLLGRGFSYDLYLMQSNFDWLSRLGHEGGVHNSYLILWLNTGLIGLVLYFRSFFLLFFRGAKLNPIAVPAMIALLFSVFFEPWMAASLNPYTIVLLVIMTIVSEKEFNPVPEEMEVEEEDEVSETATKELPVSTRTT